MEKNQADKSYHEIMNEVIKSYLELSSGEKAELRKLEDFKEVVDLYPFYKIKRQVHKIADYPDDVLACLLLFWRDRRANEEQLTTSHEKLGKLFVNGGEIKPKSPKVKANRFKRIVKAEDLEEGFSALRRVLAMLRNETLNWVEVADLLTAWNWKNSSQIRESKKKLNDAYFNQLLDNEGY